MSEHKKDLIYVCQIRSAHGVKGEFKIDLLSDDEDRLLNLNFAYLVHPKDERKQWPTIVSLNQRKPSARILSCDRIQSREDVDQFRFWYIAVERKDARKLPDGEYFICDLIGCQVFDQVHGYLGKVHAILDHGLQKVYEISAEGEKNLYFPAIESIIKHTDIEKKKIEISLPKGLFEIYRQ